MYVETKTGVQEINFMKSEHFTAFTYQAEGANGSVKDGVLKSGAIYPANDATATGIVMNEVKVSNGPQPVSVIVEGYILKDRLPEAPSAAAIEALKEIKFV